MTAATSARKYEGLMLELDVLGEAVSPIAACLLRVKWVTGGQCHVNDQCRGCDNSPHGHELSMFLILQSPPQINLVYCLTAVCSLADRRAIVPRHPIESGGEKWEQRMVKSLSLHRCRSPVRL